MRARGTLAGLLAGVLVAASLGAAHAAESEVRRGPVRAKVTVHPDHVRIGDTVTLELEVRAAAGVELLMPRFGESLGRFQVLDFAPEEHVDDAGNTVSRQSYRLYASSSGEQRIPSLIVEFVDRRPGARPAPEGEDAYELLTDPVRFTVQSVVPRGASTDLRPPPGPLADPEPALRDRPGWWLGAGLAILVLAAAGTGWWWRGARRRRASAYDVALARLQALRRRPRPGTDTPAAMDAFCVELSGIVRRYLEDRFALHAPELTTEEFLDAAAISPDLTSEHRRFLHDFLRTADEVKFARKLPAADYPETALAAVGGFLEQTRAAGNAPRAHRRPASAREEDALAG